MNNPILNPIEENTPQPLGRRALLRGAAGAGAAVIAGGAGQLLAQAPATAQTARPGERIIDYSQVPQMPWPTAPYIAWYATAIHRNADMYRNTNIDASGELNYELAYPLGISTLNWTYGTNNPYSKGPETWSGACTVESLTRGKNADYPLPPVTMAGIAIDEWVPNHKDRPLNEEWMVEGLRRGKKANPNCFIAAWVTKPTPAMFEVGRDGTVDLFIIEGYTHLGRNLPPDWALTWQEAIERCDAFTNAGLAHKTIFSFGHISPAAVSVEDGRPLTTTWLRDHMRRIKELYPDMPGVGFFPGDLSAPGTHDMIQFVDTMAGELYPRK